MDSIGLLVSGSLGLNCLEYLLKSHKVIFVLTDNKSFDIIALCKIRNIPFFSGNPRNGNAKPFINNFQIDIILSINYLFIVDQDIINLPKKIALNIHGSLLPKYRGRTPHVWAIINNEKETGITVHEISNVCDSGDILYQEKIQIGLNTTGAELLNIFFHRYPIIIEKIIQLVETNNYSLTTQEENTATFFGKRKPVDGLLNWNWQKERIFNWVRAQAAPYPGAFTYYSGEKIIINKIEFSNLGYSDFDSNGLILSGGEYPIVKTPNGAVKLVSLEAPEKIIFVKNQIFNERY